MTNLEILGSPFSNFVRTVRMALEEKGVAYTLTPTRPHTPEADAIHPLGKIPCLKHGDFSLCESRAMAAYIDKAFDGPKLFPDDPKQNALVEQWVSLCNTALVPAMQIYMVQYYFPRTPDGKPDRAAIDAAFPQVEKYMGLLDRVVAQTGYLAGDRFSYADMNILPILYYLTTLPESAAVFARSEGLKAYLAKHSERPSFVKTAPPPMSEFPKPQAAN